MSIEGKESFPIYKYTLDSDTCFDLIEQNYEFPDDVLHEIGVEAAPIPRVQIERVNIPRTQASAASINKSEYETIGITVLRHGVIGVNKIGHLFS